VCHEAIAHWSKPGNDKLNSAFQRIDEVKGKMQENLKHIIENQDDVNQMEKNSQNIQQSAFEIRSNARKLEMEARKRRCRLMAMIASIFVVVLIIIFIIVYKMTN